MKNLLPYIFNIVLCVIFFSIASYYASQTDEVLVRVIMWLSLVAWSLSFIFLMQNQEKEDKLEEIKKNQEKILKELERFHSIDVNIIDKQ